MANSNTGKMMWLDYVLFGLSIAASLGIGIYMTVTGGKHKTTEKYLMADRKLQVIPTAMSIFITTVTSVYLLGMATEMYLYGTQAWIMVLTNCVGILLSVYMFNPVMFPLKLTSMLEFHLLRFNSNLLRRLCVVLLLVMRSINEGVYIYAAATGLEAVSNFPLWAIVLTTSIGSMIYTVMGGLRAVVANDFFQGLFVLVGYAIVTILAIVKVGSISEIWKSANSGKRLIFFNMNPDPTLRVSFWTVTIGNILGYIFALCGNQGVVQRLSALPTAKKARIAMYLQIPTYFVLQSFICFLGITIYAYYDKLGCDPLRSLQVTNANQLLPFFIADALNYPGVTGMFIAVLFCATFSSLSSDYNGTAAIVWKDFLENRYNKLSGVKKVLITRLIVVAQCAASIGFAFVIPLLPGHVGQVTHSLVFAVGSPLLGTIILGILFPCANWKGCIGGMIAGLGLSIWISIGQNVLRPHSEFLETNVGSCPANATIFPMPTNPEDGLWLYKISFSYISFVGTISTVIFGLLFSLILGGQKVSEVDPKSYLKCGDTFCCCLSQQKRDTLSCRTQPDDNHICGVLSNLNDEKQKGLNDASESYPTREYTTSGPEDQNATHRIPQNVNKDVTYDTRF